MIGTTPDGAGFGTGYGLGVSTESARTRVRDNPDNLRYELLAADEVVGTILYRRSSHAIALVHTEVLPSREGQGLASRLVGGALDDIRERGLRVVPVCPYVQAYLRRHPEYGDLVTVDPQKPD
jgi:uncharacterized protein